MDSDKDKSSHTKDKSVRAYVCVCVCACPLLHLEGLKVLAFYGLLKGLGFPY